MEGKVYISVDEYNDLIEQNKALLLSNKNLSDVIDEFQKADKQKVIIREIKQRHYADGTVIDENNIEVRNFDEVRSEVEAFYKQKMIDMDNDIMEANIEKHKWYMEKLDAEIEVSRLKHRNLWQRIRNK